jgi:Acetyl-CoA carboxylase, carboxyltransferase component (subunits alpha and beta)
VAGAQQAAQAGAIDAVIAPQDTRQQLVFALDMLSSKRVSRMPKKHGNMPL